MNRVSKRGKTNARKKQDETQRHLTTTTPWHLHLPPGSLVTGFETTSSAGSRDGYPAQGAGARIGVVLMLVLHRSHLHLRLAFRGSIRLADRELKRDYSSKLERESSTRQAFVRSDRAGFQARMSAYCRLTPAATTPTLHSPCLRSCLAPFLFLFAPCSQFSLSPSSPTPLSSFNCDP